ncbi:hypothetical protein N566_05520 [Streptomycetaceae bacterium MP113-05]|nr:hypothetical protein N566_05520 [Streptomycetaceae bacterium MP113-05]
MASGASNRRIAKELSISPHTVAAHLCNMLRRTGTANRTELIARLYARGLLLQGAWPPVPVDEAQRRAGQANTQGEQKPDGAGPVPSAVPAASAGSVVSVSTASPVPIASGRPHHGNEVQVPMSFDALQALREAGHPVDLLATDQRSVLSELSELEVQVLNTVKERLESAAGEVEGQDLKLL